MAQIVQKTIDTPNWPIPTSALTMIPGISITILTGAGWILLHLFIGIQSQDAANNGCMVQLWCDNEMIASATARFDVRANLFGSVNLPFAFRPGAGQHTLTAYIVAYAANSNVSADGCWYRLHEPGY